MAEIKEVKALDNRKIYLEYTDGLNGELDLTKVSKKSEHNIPLSPEEFNQVKIDPVSGDVCWKNGASICKDASYKILDLMRLAKSLKLDLDE